MPVYTCACCNYETIQKSGFTRHLATPKHLENEAKSLKTEITLQDKLDTLTEKHTLLEEKYALLENELKMLKNVVNLLVETKNAEPKVYRVETPVVETIPVENHVDSKQTVSSTIQLLNQSHYDTPNLEETIIEMVIDDFQCPHVEGMTHVLQRIENKPFQYVENKWYVKRENEWKYDPEKSFIPYVRHQMVKRLPHVFEEAYGKVNVENEDQYTTMVCETFKELEPAHVKHILRNIR